MTNDYRSGLRAVIKIQTPPEYDPRLGAVRPGMMFGFDTAEPNPGADLLSVMTTKKLDEPCGRFTLNFVPREVVAGYTWADLIPSYSLVEIWLQRYPLNPEPVLVMLGLTRAAVKNEVFGEAEPHRTVSIFGAELGVVFADQKVLYLPTPPESTHPELVSQGQDLPPLFKLPAQLLGMLAIDPELAKRGDTPVDAIAKFVAMVTTGHQSAYNKDGRPFLNLSLPITIDPEVQRPARSELKDLLLFNIDKARAQLFDPAALMPSHSQLTKTGPSLWALMSTWSDPAYQELWTRSVDLRETAFPALLGQGRRSRSTAVCELVFRKKPFAGRINEKGNIVDTRAEVGSQFDAEFQNSPADNVAIVDNDVLTQALHRSSDRIVNLYYVYPQSPAIGSPVAFGAIYQPLLDNGVNSPAAIQRFGARLMPVSDRYFQDGGARTTDVERCRTRARLLWHWHRFEALFQRGTYTLHGNPEVRTGRRLTHRGRRMRHEFYIVGVTHSMGFQRKQPYLTTIDVERGWPIQ